MYWTVTAWVIGFAMGYIVAMIWTERALKKFHAELRDLQATMERADEIEKM